MRITRLEIFGFKSFVDRFVLNLDHSIVGIVGPNGCGKSNIVDALRWVLGETHARQLRGTVLEDLIFNGSDARRPLGMAEVAITVKPSEGWAPNAIERLNEFQAPAEQAAQAAAADQGPELDADGNIIVDGKILAEDDSEIPDGDIQVANPVPANDGPSFKDAAAALQDIPGLFEAAEIQLTRRLYRSGESEYFINRIPCRLADMVEFYRLIGLGARGLSIVQQGQIGQIVSKKPIERRELLEEAAGIAGFRSRIEAARRRLDRTLQNMERLADIVTEVDKQTRVLKRQAKRAEQRTALKTCLADSETGLFQLRMASLGGKYSAAEEALAGTTSSVEELEREENLTAEQQEEIRLELNSLDESLSAMRGERNELSAQLERGREQFRQLSLALTKAESAKVSVEERVSLLRGRYSEIENEAQETEQHSSELRLELDGLVERQSELEQELAGVRDKAVESNGADSEHMSAEALEIQALENEIRKLPELNVQIKEQRLRLEEKRRQSQDTISQVHQSELSIAKRESELASIESHLRSIAEEVNRLADGRSDDSYTPEDQNASVLVAGIEIPPELQSAVSAVLGDRARYLVSENTVDLAKRYQSSRDGSAEARAFGVIDSSIEGAAAIELSTEDLAVAPSGRLLIEQLKVRSDVNGPVQRLIGNVILVDSLDEGIELQQRFRSQNEVRDIMIATTSGEVVTPWGWYIFDGKGVELGFARRLEELKGEIAGLAEAMAETVGLVESLQLEASNDERHLTDLEEEKTKSLACQDSLNAMLARLRAEERKAREENLRLERIAQERVLDISQKKTAVEVSLRGSVEREQLLRRELVAIQEQTSAAQEQCSALSDEHERAVGALHCFQDADSATSDGENIEAQYRAVQQKLDQQESQRSERNRHLSSIGRQQESLRKKRDSVFAHQRDTQLSLEKIDLERGLLLEDIQRNYPELCMPTDEQCAELLGEFGDEITERLKALEEESSKYRRRLEREGEVDPASIEQYQTESQRLEEMQAQLSDLQSAHKTLERTIKNLKDISRDRFLKTFDSVQAKFAELVPRLFGGGAGHLELVNPEDPLSSGVELTVRPPGKKLKVLELLSGGEKALTATALLFAMFLHRPSPICVLDEVDAPLDDANLERFLALVRSISLNTQFLVITHNKVSMAAADRLVGITMQESGVTKALSVSFEEAEESLEQWAANA